MSDFTICRASLEDVDTIYSIMYTARSAMKEPELYVPDDRDFIRRHINECGFALIAKESITGTPAGFLIVRFPRDAADHLGLDLGLSPDLLPLCAHMESAAVLPEFRGNRLQQRLIARAEELLADSGFRHALGTVSPHNKYSLQNMLASGYRIGLTKLKYGGLERHIIIKDLFPILPTA